MTVHDVMYWYMKIHGGEVVDGFAVRGALSGARLLPVSPTPSFLGPVWSRSLTVAVTSQFIYACALPACHAVEIPPNRRYSADHCPNAPALGRAT